MINNRGVRKVNENIFSNGRAIIVTEKDKDKYKWGDIPVGSKFIDTITGIEMVKLEGESDWVPSGIKNDGTLCIAKDTITVIEVFRIIHADNGDDTFTYSNDKGEYRTMPFTDEMGRVFELENGSYQRGRNHLEITIDDTLHRNARSGNVKEITDRRFALSEDLHEGQEISAKYYKSFRVGQPYPRIFIGDDDPSVAENGDILIDTDYALGQHEEDGNVQNFDNVEDLDAIYSKLGHTHTTAEIDGFPTSLPANGGEAQFAQKFSTARRIKVCGDAVGEAVFDGSSDAIIQVTFNEDTFAEKVNDAAEDNIVQHIKSDTSKVHAVSGLIHFDEDLSGEGAEISIPIPDGSDRGNCMFICAPYSVTETPFYVKYTDNGMITETKNVADIKYIAIDVVNNE